MPYKIKHRGSGFKVTTPNHPQGFSKKPQTHAKAVAQLRAIKANTNEALATQIVEFLLDPSDQLQLPLKDKVDVGPWGHNPNVGEPWGGVVNMMKRREAERAERHAAEREAAKYRAAMGGRAAKPKPKAIYFSGAGYSGDGMSVVGGSGGLDMGNSAIG